MGELQSQGAKEYYDGPYIREGRIMNIKTKNLEAVLRLDASARVKMDYLMALCVKGHKPFVLNDPEIVSFFNIDSGQDISKRMFNLFVLGLAKREAVLGERGRPAYAYTLVAI